MSIYYLFDDFGRYVGETTAPTARSTPIAPARLSSEFVWTGGGWVFSPGMAVQFVPSVLRSSGPPSISDAIKQIDTDTDRIYVDVLGNRGSEYNRAEAEAEQFRTANYVSPAPDSVAAWAEAKGWDERAAADDILLQARNWRDAQQLIRRNRLKEKEALRQAQGSDVAVILGRWRDFVTSIRAQLGGGA